MENSKESVGSVSKDSQADLKAYIPGWAKKHYKDGIDNVYYYEGLPPTIGETLIVGYPNIEPTDKENESPTAKEMIDIAKGNTGHLIGYVVTKPRKDARIAVTGFEIRVSDYAARKLRKELTRREIGPDNFVKVRRRKGIQWRFWWD